MSDEAKVHELISIFVCERDPDIEIFLKDKAIQFEKLGKSRSKIKGEKITEFPSILIGQLGKNEMYQCIIAGSELLEYCLATILEGQVILGGRIIMLECKDVPYLIGLYEKFGFNVLENDYKKHELVQMIKILNEDEIIERRE